MCTWLRIVTIKSSKRLSFCTSLRLATRITTARLCYYSFMTQKHSIFSFNRYAISFLGLPVVLVAILGVIVALRAQTEAAPAAKPNVAAAVTSQFTFTGATGWTQGATNKTSKALFHKYDCFTSVEHDTGTIEADQAKFQKTEANLTGNGYVVTQGATVAATMQTNSGERAYQVQQSSVTTPAGASKIEGGQEFGYVQLPGGYLKISGYCDTADELSSTIPALSAIKFDTTK